MLTPGPTETAPTALVAGVPPKLARIGAGLILLLGALTAIGPFTIDLYLAAFPQITSDMGTSPAAVQLTITATLAGSGPRAVADRIHLRRHRPTQATARGARPVRPGLDRHRLRDVGGGADGAPLRPGARRRPPGWCCRWPSSGTDSRASRSARRWPG